LKIEEYTKVLKYCFYKYVNIDGINEISYQTKSKSQNVSPIALNIDLKLKIRLYVILNENQKAN